MAADEWAKDSHGWMYMAASGRITKSKWLSYKGSWYYLLSNGYMATGTHKIGSKTYSFDTSGKWIK
jgi:glucan-binding YG repeat protein